METNITEEEITGTSPEIVEETTDVDSTTEQDPLKVELEKVQRKEGKTEAEKAAYSLKKNAERAKELGIDPAEILGFSKSEVTDDLDDDDKPVTLGMLKRMEMEKAGQTALHLAEDIDNEAERELTKYHLESTIRSTGNPSEDLKLARAIVNAAKNSQIIEEVARKPSAKTHSSASSAPAKPEDEHIELTRDELAFTRPPFNLTEKDIIAARIQSQAKK